MTEPNLNPNPAPPAPPAPPPAAQPAPPPASRNNDTVDDLRAEAAARRIEAKNERERADKAERERDEEKENTRKAVDAEQQKNGVKIENFKKKVVDSELKAQAVAAGLKDLDLLPLIKREAIKIDDDDNIVGIEDAIKAFKESKPDYFAQPGAGDPPRPAPKKNSGDPTPPPNPNPNPPPKDVKKMTKEEYKEAKNKELRKLSKTGV